MLSELSDSVNNEPQLLFDPREDSHGRTFALKIFDQPCESESDFTGRPPLVKV
jgi:hypothetical protein